MNPGEPSYPLIAVSDSGVMSVRTGRRNSRAYVHLHGTHRHPRPPNTLVVSDDAYKVQVCILGVLPNLSEESGYATVQATLLLWTAKPYAELRTPEEVSETPSPFKARMSTSPNVANPP